MIKKWKIDKLNRLSRENEKRYKNKFKKLMKKCF